ncbi:MAG: riboflavin synthase [Candidatus Gracilibacteria bacterium]
MFSGIVETKFKIKSINAGEFVVENTFTDLTLGQSIAHDGACMTVTEVGNGFHKFFAMEETLNRTDFGSKKVGDTFNIERCVRYGDRIDGHFVTGHIDDVGVVKKIEKKDDDSQVFTISFDEKFKDLLVEKGSIALNGVSLTLVEVGNDYFTISLIPHTLEITNLGELKLGDKVNLEFDILGKYIIKSKT